MKGDFTRSTFKKENHYSSVRMQQGRVQMDADWNEQMDIQEHLNRTEAMDVIGRTGVPKHDGGFSISIETNNNDLKISKGRIYVDGILCESEEETTYKTQPDFPKLPDEIDLLGNLANGNYLVYLDVWGRHITALEDQEIREKALGGPDTASRTRTVWQVKLEKLETSTGCIKDCTRVGPGWQPNDAIRTGKLTARTKPGETSKEPCILPPGAGYRRLENQLYRVEIHKSGALGTATFKWSRDNGCITAKVVKIEEVPAGDEENNSEVKIEIKHPVSARLEEFKPGQWIELTDDAHELRQEPGPLVRITGVKRDEFTIITAAGPLTVEDFPLENNPKVRRWDTKEELKDIVEFTLSNDDYIPLEAGVEVKFADGHYQTGDYWLIPARSATGEIEWPRNGPDDPVFKEPDGISHHYCALGYVEAAGGKFKEPAADCRNLFPSLTNMTRFFYVSGDGQEAMPGNELPMPLQVGVANGELPIENAVVKFKITKGKGKLNGNGLEITATTNANGIAPCKWKLDSNVKNYSQQVEAVLLDECSNAASTPIRFNANLSIAEKVYYDPGGCTNLKGDVTVQKALDKLSSLTTISYLGGDGQEALPGEALPKLLQVKVTNKCAPVNGAKVQFKAEGNGRVSTNLAGLSTAASNTIDINTGSDGIASCAWKPEENLSMPSQQLTATLVSAGNNVIQQPAIIRFTANLSVASQVAYNPGACSYLKDEKAETVQQAIDALCKRESRGGCAVTVGQDGQFKRLDEAINTLIKEKKTDICICLLPGNHNLNGGLNIKGSDKFNINVKIVGCGPGTHIYLKKPLIINYLASFTMRDITMTLDKDIAILCNLCQEVTLESCTLTGINDAFGLVAAIELVDRLCLEDNQINAYTSTSFSNPRKVFKGIGYDLAVLFEILDPMDFNPKTFKIASQIYKLSKNERSGIVQKIKKSIKNLDQQKKLSDLEKESYNDFTNALGADKLDSKLLLNSIKNIRKAALLTHPGNALLITGGDADVTIENNNINGVINLYGLNTGITLSDEELKSLAEGMESGARLLRSGAGRLQVRNNRFTRMVIGDDVVKKIMTRKGDLENLFSESFISDNRIEGGQNQWLSVYLNMTSNFFAGKHKNFGLTITNSVVFVSNQTPFWGKDYSLRYLSLHSYPPKKMDFNSINIFQG